LYAITAERPEEFMDRKDIRTIGLLSGGLDSALSLAWMHRLGFDIVVCHFENGFHAVPAAGEGQPLALQTAERLGVPIRHVDISREMIQVVMHPEHGYGSHVNPCIDCRILMFRTARRLMAEERASFIFTGEVVGQRPMSQRRQIMNLIDRESGMEGLVVRPLCGRLMAETAAEREGWIGRDELLDIQGRGRKRQMALAEELGIGKYEMPAGGCLLTDGGFEVRLRDLLRFGEPTVQEVGLLKLGRHFRIGPRAKAILGRDAADCEALEARLGADDLRLDPRDIPGPLGTIRGEASPEAVREVASLVLRYAKAPPDDEHVVTVRWGGNATAAVEHVSVRPMDEDRSRFLLVAAEGNCGGYGREGTGDD
jgi:predicted subunit of tRNA(5-methylaminomethyl-2-thiouridylate) methyltransferase